MKQEHHNIRNDYLKRKFFIKKEFKSLLLKSYIKSSRLPTETKLYIILKYSALRNYARLIRIRNRCNVSGRGYGIFKKEGLSRFFMRQESHKLNKLGIRRKSW